LGRQRQRRRRLRRAQAVAPQFHSSEARMGAATCGVPREVGAGCRSAHPGYSLLAGV
jgi:hypothetical protein